MDQNLADLVQKKQKQSGTGVRIDWDERRDKYVAAVQALYEQIKTMLAEPIGQKTVTLQQRLKLGPSRKSEPVSIVKAEPAWVPGVVGRGWRVRRRCSARG